MNIGWPEAIFLILLVIGFIFSTKNDGSPKPIGVYSVVVVASLLWWGGFFE